MKWSESKKQTAQEKLRRLAKTYNDLMIPDEEYHHKKRLLELELESLIIPEINATQEAGKLIINLPQLWASANGEEKRRLVLSVLDAVYADAMKRKTIVAIKPKPPFIPIFRGAVSKKESDIRIQNEPLNSSSKGSTVFLVETGAGPRLRKRR
jgi:site-specific DNA recombinase